MTIDSILALASPNLKALIERCWDGINAKSHRERAQIEKDLWKVAGKEVKGNRKQWLATVFGCPHHDIQGRSKLYSAGDMANPLWERCDNGGLTATRAESLFDAAKQIAREQDISVGDAVLRVALEYDRSPHVTNVSGRTYRKKSPRNLRRATPGKNAEPQDADNSRSFFRRVRQEVSNYISPRLEGFDPLIAEQLTRSLETSLNGVLDEFGLRLSRTVTELKNGAKIVSRRSMVQACEVLQMQPPRLGERINLKKARKIKQAAVLKYHPDRHMEKTPKAIEQLTAHYQMIIEAFDVIEKYEEGQKS